VKPQSVPTPGPAAALVRRLQHKAAEGVPQLNEVTAIEGRPTQEFRQDPVHKEPGGYRWGTKGKLYKTRAAAERQGRAAFANGYREDELRKRAKHLKASPRAESRYVLDLQQILGALHAAALHIVRRELSTAVPESGLRQDAGLAAARHRIGKLWGQMSDWVRRKVGAAFGRMAVEVKDRTAQGTKLLGIQVRRVPGLDTFIDEQRAANVALIRTASLDFLDQVRDVLSETEGQTADDIADAVEERVGVSASRAQLIARDQTLRLNAGLSQKRQEAVGGERYVWNCSLDERVAGNPGGKYPKAEPSHWERHGKVYEWANPPDEDEYDGHPGQNRPQCRCVAVPVIDDLEPEAEPEEAGGDDEDEG